MDLCFAYSCERYPRCCNGAGLYIPEKPAYICKAIAVTCPTAAYSPTVSAKAVIPRSLIVYGGVGYRNVSYYIAENSAEAH